MRNRTKFPRTFNEAFPNSMENGACIEIHVAQLTIADKVARVVSLIALIVLALDCFIWRP
jgi:hypothetical protein